MGSARWCVKGEERADAEDIRFHEGCCFVLTDSCFFVFCAAVLEIILFFVHPHMLRAQMSEEMMILSLEEKARSETKRLCSLVHTSYVDILLL